MEATITDRYYVRLQNYTFEEFHNLKTAYKVAKAIRLHNKRKNPRINPRVTEAFSLPGYLRVVSGIQ